MTDMVQVIGLSLTTRGDGRKRRTVIVLAGSAAMAPETAIGAASPLAARARGETMQAKEKNILKATVRCSQKTAVRKQSNWPKDEQLGGLGGMY